MPSTAMIAIDGKGCAGQPIRLFKNSKNKGISHQHITYDPDMMIVLAPCTTAIRHWPERPRASEFLGGTGFSVSCQ